MKLHSNVNIHSQGTDFDLKVFEDEYHLHVKTVGMFNVYNLLAAFGAVPLPLLSQYMPFQYTLVREGKLNNTPEDLIKARVMYTIEEYTYASHQEELIR